MGEGDLINDPRPPGPLDIVCCSLENWDDIWRRNQFLAAEMLGSNPAARILFVEPPVDMAWAVLRRQRVNRSRLRPAGDTGRLWLFTPRKWAPRRVWPYVDLGLGRQVTRAAKRVGFTAPLLWLNDNTYAPLALRPGWPTLYDITDDWLHAGQGARELERQVRNDNLALQTAREVVVCSPNLVDTRGTSRPVHLIPNGVDVAFLRAPQPRPADLPASPIVLYTGTLSETRLDVDLCCDLARRLQDDAVGTFVLVGPNSLTTQNTDQLTAAGALVLGARPYKDLPGYLQVADIIVVPHVVSPFTESLDPIKAREIVAVGRPAVSTPVAGFRDLGPPVTVATADQFVGVVLELLAKESLPAGPGPLRQSPTSWSDRAREFSVILRKCRQPEHDQIQPG